VAPIIGPKTAVQLKDNLAALEVELPADAVERIDAASESYPPYPHDFVRMARQLTATMVQQNAALGGSALPSWSS
jgi:diketogulonate reductase-like aldo/keto reductase